MNAGGKDRVADQRPDQGTCGHQQDSTNNRNGRNLQDLDTACKWRNKDGSSERCRASHQGQRDPEARPADLRAEKIRLPIPDAHIQCSSLEVHHQLTDLEGNIPHGDLGMLHQPYSVSTQALRAQALPKQALGIGGHLGDQVHMGDEAGERDEPEN